MYVVLLSAIGPVGLAVTTNLNINFLRKAAGAGRAGRGKAVEARQAAGGRRVNLLSGRRRSHCPRDSDLLHSN